MHKIFIAFETRQMIKLLLKKVLTIFIHKVRFWVLFFSHENSIKERLKHFLCQCFGRGIICRKRDFPKQLKIIQVAKFQYSLLYI